MTFKKEYLYSILKTKINYKMRKLFIDRMIPFLLLVIFNVIAFFGEVHLIGFSVIATLIIRGTTLGFDWFLTKPYVWIRNKLTVYFKFKFPKSPLFASYLGYSFGLSIFFFVHFVRLLILYTFDMVTVESMLRSLGISILFIFIFAWLVDLITKKVKIYFKKE